MRNGPTPLVRTGLTGTAAAVGADGNDCAALDGMRFRAASSCPKQRHAKTLRSARGGTGSRGCLHSTRLMPAVNARQMKNR